MSNQKPDWSTEKFREMLIYQRKFMWREDTLDIYAKWAGFKKGMIVTDIGCGLGFLGYSFWDHFGSNGHYIGVDTNLSLLKDASNASHDWPEGGVITFINGNAYNIPIPDNTCDMVMCQTLLMHLKRPEDCLKEMKRITKPGGVILCSEPDNLSSMLSKRFWTLPDYDLDEMLLMMKVIILSCKGRINLGLGDFNIGVKITHMMGRLGLIDIDARLNDGVWFVEPPYSGEKQLHRLKIIKRNMLEDEHVQFWREKNREEFIAGGGTSEEYERYIQCLDRIKPLFTEQIENGTFASCGSSDMYFIKGRKPESSKSG